MITPRPFLSTVRVSSAFSALVLCALGFVQRVAAADAATSAIAVIQHTTGSEVAGTVTFTAAQGGVKVVVDVTGLPPGKHGFHIHEFGDVSDTAKGMNTGGHFDPAGTKHHALVAGEHSEAGHHAGDMGNLEADSNGHAHLEMMLTGVSVMGPQNPIIGRAVIIHEKADDGGQPTGNAGGRLGQGVIGIAKAR
jgi:Cu-Zn family superoxide dismutase